MPDPLRIEKLAHRYGTKAVFQDVDLHVASGECVALLGESGCGKTTLLRDIAGLAEPSAGELRIGGVLASGAGASLPPGERGVGLVFQDYALFPTLGLAENIAFGLRSPNPGRVAELVKLAGLEGLEKSLPSQLSGGQQQRTALARALAPRPALLLLDEPFANIDAGMRRQLGESLRRILKSEEASVLLVTHDRLDAFSMSDRIAVMGSGRDGIPTIQQLGTPEEVYHRPATAEVAKLTGDVLLLPAQAEGDHAECALGRIGLLEAGRGEVLLAIRPEQLQVRSGLEGNAEAEGCFFAGERYGLRIRTGESVFTAYSDSPVVPGTHVAVSAVQAVWALP
jgi:iron(III) transport system ATP-binding protein